MIDTTPERGPASAGHDGPPSGRRVVLLAVLMVVAQLGFRAWAVSGSWYRFDDANFMSKLMADGLSSDLLFSGYAGHLMPGAYLLTSLNLHLDPFSWTYPAAELLLLQALTSAGAVVFLVSAFGRRPGILAPLGLFLFSAISLPAFVSWGPGITQLPFQAAIFWGGWANLSYLRTRRVRWAVVTLLISLAAIGFGEKALLVFLTYGVVALAYFATGDIVARVKHVVRHYLPGVVLYAVAALGYGIAYLAVALNVDSNQATSHQNLAALTGHVAGDSWATGVLGGPFRWRWVEGLSAGLAAPGQVVTLAAVILLAVLGWELGRTRARSGRAWWLVGAVLVSDLALIATTRSTFVGPDVGLAYRYLTEMAAVSAVALGLATMALRGAVETVEVRRTSAFLDQPWRVTAAVAAVAVLGTYSSFGYARSWHDDHRTRDYFANARHDLESSPQPVALADTAVPSWMIWGLAYPDNLVSHTLRSLSAHTTFPSVATNTLAVVDTDGHVRPILVKPVRRAVATPVDRCPYPVERGRVVIPLDGPVVGGGWWVRLNYGAVAAGTLHVTAGDASYDVPVQQGLHNLFFQARGDRFQQITLSDVTPGSLRCVTSLDLGTATAYHGDGTGQ